MKAWVDDYDLYARYESALLAILTKFFAYVRIMAGFLLQVKRFSLPRNFGDVGHNRRTRVQNGPSQHRKT